MNNKEKAMWKYIEYLEFYLAEADNVTNGVIYAFRTQSNLPPRPDNVEDHFPLVT